MNDSLVDHYNIAIQPAGNSRVDTETTQGSSSVSFILTVQLICWNCVGPDTEGEYCVHETAVSREKKRSTIEVQHLISFALSSLIIIRAYAFRCSIN